MRRPRTVIRAIGILLLILAAGLLVIRAAGMAGLSWVWPGRSVTTVSGGRVQLILHDPGVTVSGLNPGLSFGGVPRYELATNASSAQFGAARGGIRWLCSWDVTRLIVPARGNPAMVTLRLHPLPIALLLGVPAAAAWWLARRRRQRAGRCAACGYDLTGLAPQATCPECGGREDLSSLASRCVGQVT